QVARQPVDDESDHHVHPAVVSDGAADERQACQCVFGDLVGPDQRVVGERPHRRVPEEERELDEQEEAERHVKGVLQPRREAMICAAMNAISCSASLRGQRRGKRAHGSGHIVSPSLSVPKAFSWRAALFRRPFCTNWLVLYLGENPRSFRQAARSQNLRMKRTTMSTTLSRRCAI